MSWRDAPLYTEVHALAVDLFPRLAAWRAGGEGDLAQGVAARCTSVLDAVGVALTFPDDRRAALRDADHALLQLRLLLRVAFDLGLVSAGAHRVMTTRMLACGRMIGGWRQRVEPTARSPPPA